VGIDRPDDDDQPAVRRAADQTQSPDVTRSALQTESRDRETYYADLRAAVEAERTAAADEPDARDVDRDRGIDEWTTVTEQFREAWTEHQSRWPRPEREREEATIDSDGGWHGDGGRVLDRDANETVDRGCERIREVEATTITPAMRRIEAQDPNRELIGLEHRLKGTDRLKEKVADQVRSKPDVTAGQALSAVPDAVRFTFCYSEDRYSGSVRADIRRLREQGFAEVELRNSWTSEHYKGINSRWREPTTGSLFEIQFHTLVSFEAKQLTHAAYERIRQPTTSRAELRELQTFQRQVCAKVSVPPGAEEIGDEHDDKDDILRNRG
jgi:hypothetical protein